jgi:hypothetical protein
MGCARIRKRKKRSFPQERSPKVIRLALGQSKTVYATMQPAALAAAPSMGVEEEGSDSGTVEVMVKSDPKKSIVVYVVRELKDAMKL